MTRKPRMLAALIAAVAVTALGGGIGLAAPQGKPAPNTTVTTTSTSGREIVSITTRCNAGQYDSSCHGAYKTAKVLCPGGKVAFGGGLHLVSGPELVSGLDDSTDFYRAGGAFIASQPDDDAGAGWFVTVRAPDDAASPWELTVYAVCATP